MSKGCHPHEKGACKKEFCKHGNNGNKEQPASRPEGGEQQPQKKCGHHHRPR